MFSYYRLQCKKYLKFSLYVHFELQLKLLKLYQNYTTSYFKRKYTKEFFLKYEGRGCFKRIERINIL